MGKSPVVHAPVSRVQCQWQDEATMSEQDKLLGGKFHAPVVYSRCHNLVKNILSNCPLPLSRTHTAGTNNPPPYYTSPPAQAGQALPPPYQQYPSTTTVVVGQILPVRMQQIPFLGDYVRTKYHKSS